MFSGLEDRVHNDIYNKNKDSGCLSLQDPLGSERDKDIYVVQTPSSIGQVSSCFLHNRSLHRNALHDI